MQPVLGFWIISGLLLILLAPFRHDAGGGRTVFKILILLIAIALLNELSGILPALFMSILFSYVFAPLMRTWPIRKMSPGLGAALVVLLFILVMSLLLVGIGPLVVKQMLRLAAQVPDIVARFSAFLHGDFLTWLNRYGLSDSDIQSFIATKVPEYFQLLLKQLTNGFSVVVNSVSGLAGKVLNLLLTPIMTYYFLVNQTDFEHEITNITSTRTSMQMKRYTGQLNKIVSGYLRGQLIVSAIIAVLIWLGLSIMGIDYALLLGIMTGVAYVVPYVGAAFSFLTAAIITLMVGSGWMAVAKVAGVFAVVASLESVIITPRIMGGSLGVNPILVILGIFLFGSLFGFFGVMFAVPLTAIALFVYRDILARRSGVETPKEDQNEN